MELATLDRLSFIADAPNLAAVMPDGAPEDIPADQALPTSWVQIAKTGTFQHPLYGKFSVTQDTFDSFIRNFQAGVPTDELPVDFDHEPDYGGKTEACGWIRDLRVDGGTKLMALVEWTWQGACAIRDKSYRYVSPTWKMAYQSDDGTKRGPTLLAFGLTNRPFFEQMAYVSLSQTFSRQSFELASEVDGELPRAASDSRPHMELIETLRQVFSLPADADEDTVLTAAREATEKTETPETFTRDQLDAAAKAQGFSLVAPSELAELTVKANKGEKASQDLAAMRFDAAFKDAMDAGKVGDAQRDHFHKIFDADEDLCIETLSSLQPVVQTAAKGALGATGDAGDAPRGVDQDDYELDQKVQAHLAAHPELKGDYVAALAAVRDAEAV